MAHNYHKSLDEERRDLLKALGVGGTVAIGSATLGDVRSVVTANPSTDLESIAENIKADVAGELDASLLADQQTELASAASALPAVPERGLPEDSPRSEFTAVETAAQPVYDHLIETGFFESTTEHLPEFTSGYLTDSVQTFVGSASLAAPLTDLGLTEEEGVDLIATVVGHAEDLEHHWIPTDKLTREHFEGIEHVPPMTQAAAGGVVLWLEDMDEHVWKNGQIMTESIVADAAWYGHAMTAGFHLMAEGAKRIGAGDETLSNDELTALLSTGFAVQTISQFLLPEDVYWISEEMRGSRRTDLEVVSDQPHM